MAVIRAATPHAGLYRHLMRTAEAGGPCPSLDKMCDRFGFGCPDTAHKALVTLQRVGRVEIDRDARDRRFVFVPAVGKSTAPVGGRGIAS